MNPPRTPALPMRQRALGQAGVLAVGVVGFFAIPRAGILRTTTGLEPTVLTSVRSGQDEKFSVIENPDRTVTLMCEGFTFLAAAPDGAVTLSDGALIDWESWELAEHSDDSVSLKSYHGKYLSADPDGRLEASSNHSGPREKFNRTRHADGMISLVAPGGEAISVRGLNFTKVDHRQGRYAAFSKTGKAGTTELLQKVNGSDDTVALKFVTHGAYLTVDTAGLLTAESTSVGKMQSFELLRHEESSSEETHQVVSLKAANGMYITAFPNGTLKAIAPVVKDWEKFALIQHHHGGFVLLSNHSKYLTMSSMPIYTFYMYRAEQEQGRPWENVNTGNLGGVLWYIHNEVVVENPRKYAISRITRMKFQMATTPQLAAKGLRFGARFAYDTGMCTGAGPINGWSSCTDSYAKYGNFVGCNYLGDFPFPMTSKGFGTEYQGGIWYNLPKDGHCYEAPTGMENCTYSYEPAGYLDISALYGVDNYWVWASTPGNIEYDKATDKGVGTDFFDHLYDAAANQKRVEAAQRLFDQKYPGMPREGDLQNPDCDFHCKRFYTEGEMQQVGDECRCSERYIAKRFYDVGPDECKLNSQSGHTLKDMGYYAGKDTR